ncbi:DUF1850 domain-containing protein [Chelatococcus reniformis]|uniref:DUF1850 domain-containing protein n=1 Tax=Chelatococcus reniformis TaxID=1494448 RepID=A0A916UTD7_9HYPH|nr:DUF1850 domain-containing protein [Chelatococcus reniformis]GGC87533.1 hypothetical protein GCM10010994_51880 [Chelatococcus reniformis]
MTVSLCLLAGGVIVRLGVEAATLAWSHSVEKILWEEDWRATPAGLVLDQARVRGSGAGMEPPPDARLSNDVWSWRPTLAPLPQVVMRRSGATADWRICARGACRVVGDLVPRDADPVLLEACGDAHPPRSGRR